MSMISLEAYVSYCGFYLLSITYPFTASAFIKEEHLQLEKKPLNAIISKIGMSSKIHRIVIYAQRNYKD